MSHTLPDPVMARRVAMLERQVEQLQQQLRLMTVSRGVTPLNARLWRATLNAGFSSYEAAADLLTISGADTGLDVTLFDPEEIFVGLTGTEGIYIFEQIDVDGTTRFVPMQTKCPTTS